MPALTIVDLRATLARSPAQSQKYVKVLSTIAKSSASIPDFHAKVKTAAKTMQDKKLEMYYSMLVFASQPEEVRKGMTGSSLGFSAAAAFAVFPPKLQTSTGRKPVAATVQKAQRRTGMKKVAAGTAAQLKKSTVAIQSKMVSQKQQLQQLEAQLAQTTNPAQAAALRTRKEALLRTLAATVAAAKIRQAQVVGSQQPFNVGYVNAVQAKTLIASVNVRLGKVKEELASNRRLLKQQKPGAMRNATFTRIVALKAEAAMLRKRLAALRKGRDLIELPLVSGQIARIPLNFNSENLPNFSKELVAHIIKLLIAQMPQRANEARNMFLFRLRMYLRRALARYVVLVQAGTATNAAANAAAQQTVSQDSQALEAEYSAGGEAPDAAATAVSLATEAAAPLMDQAVTSAQAGVAPSSATTVASAPSGAGISYTHPYDSYSQGATNYGPDAAMAAAGMQPTQVGNTYVSSTPFDPMSQAANDASAGYPSFEQPYAQAQEEYSQESGMDESVSDEAVPTEDDVGSDEDWENEESDYEEVDEESTPWYKNKLLWAAGALGAYFLL